MTHVIHDNPDCGTSRNVLAIIEASGEVPVGIDYLSTGCTRPQLLGLFAAADLTPRTALRTTKFPAEELGLLDSSVADETLLSGMSKHPVLINRPIVRSPKAVRLCRPGEAVLDFPDSSTIASITKEVSTLLIDAKGNREGLAPLAEEPPACTIKTERTI